MGQIGLTSGLCKRKKTLKKFKINGRTWGNEHKKLCMSVKNTGIWYLHVGQDLGILWDCFKLCDFFFFLIFFFWGWGNVF